jgi:hypothetical protein
MNKLAFLLVIAVLFSPCFAQDSSKTQVAIKNVTIIGTIKNFDEFVTFVEPETYIQLIAYSADERIVVNYDMAVRVTIISNLQKFSVPKKAMFKFVVPNIQPGKYFLSAQKLKFQVTTGSGHVPGQRPFFMTENGDQIFIIDVPPDSKSQLTINAGDLIVWTH